MSMQTVILGTRGSKLAIWQTEYLARELKRVLPELDVEIKIIKTKGDKILDVALSKIGDKGLFTREIENELLAGSIDMAVHSMKDLPSVLDEDLMIGAVLKREDPCDVLLSHKGYTLDTLPSGAIVGTSSLRRVAQLKSVRADLKTVDIRGNVETRIRKMKEQDLDAIILAYAGVKRLGFEDSISDKLSTQIIIPAVGQGAVAVEIRKNDPRIENIARYVSDQQSYAEGMIERAFLNELNGGCQVPIASLAGVEGDSFTIEGLIASLDGKKVFRSRCEGKVLDGEKIARELARQLMDSGADLVLAELMNQ